MNDNLTAWQWRKAVPTGIVDLVVLAVDAPLHIVCVGWHEPDGTPCRTWLPESAVEHVARVAKPKGPGDAAR